MRSSYILDIFVVVELGHYGNFNIMSEGDIEIFKDALFHRRSYLFEIKQHQT